MRKISLFIATSLDGYIAKPNDDLDFLKLVEKNKRQKYQLIFTDSRRTDLWVNDIYKDTTVDEKYE
jgi:hypothetical protein